MNKTRIAAVGKSVTLLGFFVLLFLLAIGMARAESRGAEVSIVKIDRTELRGELIAVRGETLILLSDGVDASVKLEEISSLAVHGRSKALAGTVSEDASGTKAGAKTGDDPAVSDQELGRRVLSRDSTSTEAALNVLTALLRVASDAKVSKDEVYLLEGIKTASRKKEFLRHLNGLARVKSAQ